MSMDLDFWKYEKGIYLDNKEVYQKACCDGEEVSGLELLPVDDILNRIALEFKGWTVHDNNYEKDGQGAFSIFTTSQIVRFDCYSMDYVHLNLLIDIMLEFGCPLYDPQISERFDGEDEAFKE